MSVASLGLVLSSPPLTTPVPASLSGFTFPQAVSDYVHSRLTSDDAIDACQYQHFYLFNHLAKFIADPAHNYPPV